MSRALFHDTITLYLPVDDEAIPERRIVSHVKTILSHGQESGCQATVYIPLWRIRSLRYQPEGWEGRSNGFTVRPGDRLVCETADTPTPPEGALTVRTVICRTGGSHRLWHLEVHADNKPEKEESTNDNTNT